MKKTVFAVFILFLLNSCFEFNDLEFNGMENLKANKIENKTISLTLDLKILNPNGFSIKVKPSNVDVFVEEQLIGKAYLNKKVTLAKKKENVYPIDLRVELEDGVMLKLVRFALKDKVKIRFVGDVKGSVLGITKKIKLDETKEIDGKNFKLNSLMK